MRVLEVARQFYPKVGGIESCVLNLSRGLVARGHTVEVVTLDRDLQSGHRLDSPAAIDGIAIHRIPYFGSRRYPVAPSWLRFAHDFDVIHIHAIDFFMDSAALGKRVGIHRKPLVVTTHGGIFHTPALRPIKDFYWRQVLKRSLRAAMAVVAVSERDAELFRSIVPEEKLHTIPNGIDSVFGEASRTRYPIGNGPHTRRLICVGRVSKAKAIDRVIDLFAQVAPDFPELELVIAGPDDNGEADVLRRRSAVLGLESRVRIVGGLPLDALAGLVANADLFISAAPHEGFGITTVEALCAGVPVMVTRTGVHEQIVQPGVNGWFWSGIPDAQAAATLREGLLLPDARLHKMQIAARASAAPFNWDTTTDKYERVLESAHRQGIG